ncbi:MAG: hypothetical protein U0132_00670 [Gemmatimonadaceae bacterium]
MRKIMAVVLASAVIGAVLPAQAEAMGRRPRAGRSAKASAPRKSAPPPARPSKDKGGKRKKAAASMTALPKVDLPDGIVPNGGDGGGGRGRRRAALNTASPSSGELVAPKVNYNSHEKSSFKAPATNTGVNPNAGKKSGKHGGGKKRH